MATAETLDSSFARSQERAVSLRKAVDIVRSLPVSMRRQFVLDVLALADDSSDHDASAISSNGTTENIEPSKPIAVQPGHPVSDSNGVAHHIDALAGPTQKIFKALGERPGRSLQELAAIVYGESTALTYRRVRSVISSLAKQKKVRRIGPGRWKAVQE